MMIIRMSRVSGYSGISFDQQFAHVVAREVSTPPLMRANEAPDTRWHDSRRCQPKNPYSLECRSEN